MEQNLTAHHLTIDNAADVTLENTVRSTGIVTFVNGIVGGADPSKALVMGEGSTVAGISDASHVDGYVLRKVWELSFTRLVTASVISP